MTLLVTGATGQLGSKVVAALIERGLADNLAISVRNPEKASGLPVDVRHGDFDDAASLASAFAGVKRLLLISTDGDTPTRIRQHTAAVKAAQEAGVGFIAYTSVVNAANNPLALAEVHRATEEAIRATGIPFAFLRNNWYLENDLSALQAALGGGPVATNAGSGKIGWALRADYAAAAAAVLAGGHENSIYELSGPLHTYDELGAALSEVVGHAVPVNHVDDATYGSILGQFGLPGFLVEMFVGFGQSIREGALDIPSDDFARLLGRPVTPLADALRQLKQELSAQA